MPQKIYYWPSLNFQLYAPGHAVAIAESFGRAVDQISRDYPDIDKNVLLSTPCEEIQVGDGFSLLFTGWV